ncbi:NADP-dependent oxidoreductase [Kribbella solani]|uniref:NADPH:quinone reductase-like Zn-dependent oxidoreductase n=1 Tax=Kribbella solani TaxID=236067 RepID=A0A841DXD4_9ACTN|nr:NADP-dependent oxidoreductase [Kribbella solani]MBB5983312.1 NADPH:quinone reductase-like Zn-dependent oxidoreductase [Kribbella solani]MDX2972859.1 NADP-dependent oxidoreductase [Kribbella solani]MDX3004196.1 NADP-dependent oxidoreductase [Kribbella solani]
MRAVVFEEFGGPEVLKMEDRPEPQAGPGQVRIAVRAAGVNPYDFKMRRGWTRAFAEPVLPAIPGFEVAGVVDQAGEGAAFAVGDEVVGWSQGGAYAEYAIAGTIAVKPAGLSWEQAASIPIAGETAQRVLDEVAVKPGETVLIHGAAGAVGSVAVQLAKAAGLTVVGTASAANHDYLRSIGAIPVAYGDGLLERVREVAPQGIDAVIDTAGKGGLEESIELRGGTERIVTIADYEGAGKLGIKTSGGGREPEEIQAGLTDQLQAAADGKLTVRIAATYALADAGEAQDLSESGHARGKVLVLP